MLMPFLSVDCYLALNMPGLNLSVACFILHLRE